MLNGPLNWLLNIWVGPNALGCPANTGRNVFPVASLPFNPMIKGLEGLNTLSRHPNLDFPEDWQLSDRFTPAHGHSFLTRLRLLLDRTFGLKSMGTEGNPEEVFR